MKKNLMVVALAAVALASCNGGFKKGDGGLLYNIHTDKSGPNIAVGDFAVLDMVIKNDGDSILKSSYEMGMPQYLILQKPEYKGDVFSGMALLSEGDSATIKISADSIFKSRPKPPGFKSKYIIYDLKVEKVIPKGKLTDQQFQQKYMAYVTSQMEVIKNHEGDKINKYIADNKLKTTKTATGLNYVINKPGAGAVPNVGDTVVVNYVGKFFNGKVFDTSIKAEAVKAKLQINPMNPYTPIHIAVGQQKVIPGWDQGLMLLNKGAKATLIVPSSLAYGEQGNPPIIAPFTPLVFDVEIIDIIHGAPAPAATPAPAPAKK
ncbi:MAG: FKBP-type peptidyl-prolyl cis-trans isomerase [Mucilaginibacter sp.]